MYYYYYLFVLFIIVVGAIAMLSLSHSNVPNVPYPPVIARDYGWSSWTSLGVPSPSRKFTRFPDWLLWLMFGPFATHSIFELVNNS